MTRWLLFAGFVGFLTTAMVALTILTQRALEPYDETSDDAVADAMSVDDSTLDSGAANDDLAANEDLAVDDDLAVDEDLAVDDDRRGPGEGNTVGDEPDDSAIESTHVGSVETGAGTPDPAFGPTGSPETAHDPTRMGRDQEATTDTGSARPAGKRIVATVDGTPVTARGLVVNVTVTQALFLALLVGAILAANVPPTALGVEGSLDAVGPAVVGGIAIGLGFYVASEVVGALVVRAGFGHDEWLRESLAPATIHGWVILLVVVLPLIAVFEELLFRAVLIGALATGFAISEWLLVVGSTVVFAVGHGIQGSAGILVTGLIGFGLAVAFVVSGSLLLVVVAHYVLNCCEFVIHEGLDVEWQSAFAG